MGDVRRWIVTAAAAVTVVLSGITGCAGPIGANSPSTLRIWYSTDDPVERGWSQTLANLFAKSHPNVKVALTDYAFEDFNPKMQLALSSGQPPDLAYATPRVCGIPVYVQHGKLVNLTPYAHKYGWARLLRPGLLQDYNSPFALYATQRYGLPAKAVPVYAVPDAMAAVAVMYNRRLLTRLRLSIPATLAQFEREVATAKRAGFVPLGLGNADGWLGDDWYQTLVNTIYGYSDLERELRVVPGFDFGRKGFVRMASVLYGWRNDFTPNFAGLTAQDGVDSFFRGRTLFQLISSSEDSQILSDQGLTHVPIGVFAFPDGSRGVMPQSGYEGWVIPKDGHNRALAVQFINWLLKPSTTRFLLAHGVLPAHSVSNARVADGWERTYLRELNTSRPGVFLDAAPLPNLNATMEANVQLLLASVERPGFLSYAMHIVYSSHGKRHGTIPQIDCEF